MHERLGKIFAACLLLLAFVLAGCARDIEVRAKGQVTVSVGVGGK